MGKRFKKFVLLLPDYDLCQGGFSGRDEQKRDELCLKIIILIAIHSPGAFARSTQTVCFVIIIVKLASTFFYRVFDHIITRHRIFTIQIVIWSFSIQFWAWPKVKLPSWLESNESFIAFPPASSLLHKDANCCLTNMSITELSIMCCLKTSICCLTHLSICCLTKMPICCLTYPSMCCLPKM